MDLSLLDKAYSEYDEYMRKVKGYLTLPTKLDLRLWEEWKIKNGYEESSTKKKNAVKSQEELE